MRLWLLLELHFFSILSSCFSLLSRRLCIWIGIQVSHFTRILGHSQKLTLLLPEESVHERAQQASDRQKERERVSKIRWENAKTIFRAMHSSVNNAMNRLKFNNSVDFFHRNIEFHTVESSSSTKPSIFTTTSIKSNAMPCNAMQNKWNVPNENE